MEKAVVYARYSSHSQTEQSIEGQLSAAKKYALDKGYLIIEEYCDRAKTGTNDNRDEFQRMLSDTSKHQFTVIIVWKVDRFGRNREEIAFNKHHCKKNGVRIEYVAENIADGPEGVILESVLEGMAEYYSLQLSQNIKRGRLESARKFKAISGRVPFGFTITHDRKYNPDPEKAEIVRHIFERIASGESMTEVTNWLNAEHCLTSQGNPFTKNSLPRILNNELYLGIYKYKDLVYAENAVPAIIDRDLWDRAHEMLQKHRRETHSSWVYKDYLLTGKLFCGECGASMTGLSGTSKSGTKYNYYTCVQHRLEHTCDKRSIRADILEKKIIDLVKSTILTQPMIEHFVNLVWQHNCNRKERASKLDRLNEQLSDQAKARDNLIKAVEHGMDYDLVRLRLEDLNNKINELESMIATETLAQPFQLTKDDIQSFLSQFMNLDYSYRKYQKKLIDVFINSITVYEKELVIAFNYSSNGKLFSCSTVCDQLELSKLQANTIVVENVVVIKVQI